MNKFSSLGLGIGALFIASSQFLYTVHPGEKVLLPWIQALILDNLFGGLKQKVYEPGYNLKIPFIQVRNLSCRKSSITTAESSQQIFQCRLVPKIYKLSISAWEFYSSPSLKHCPRSISPWAETTIIRYSTPSASKFLELLSPNVLFSLCRRCWSVAQEQRDY